ncbi:MAG: hypothetical protein ABIQ12_15180, partial [Opitutaceae bacterium]
MFAFRFPRGLRFAGAFVFSLVAADAQTPLSTRPLTHDDFDGWRSIATPQLSRDGRWLAYSFMPQDADGELIVREVATGKEHRVSVGALPPPAVPPADENPNPEAPPVVRNIRIAFTSDNRFVVAATHPPKAELAAARRAKKKSEELPKGGLVTVNLASGAVTRDAGVKNFQVPTKGGAWVAFLKEAKLEEKKTDETKPAAETTEPNETKAPDAEGDDDVVDPATLDAAARRFPSAAAGPATTAVAGERTFGTELVLRQLEQGSERTLAAVSDYSFARDGRTLL